MAVKLSSLRVDRQRENEGEWVEFPEHIDTDTGEVPALKVRGTGYGPFQTAMSIEQGRWARIYGATPVPVDVQHSSNGRLYADHILLEWRGFSETYDPEFAKTWLTDPESRPVHVLIRSAMSRVGQVEAEFIKDAAKNSQRSSSGSSKTATV